VDMLCGGMKVTKSDDYECGRGRMHPSRGRSKKRWMNFVKVDMRIKGVSMEMTSGRREWKK
jgi:hypothetical protein